MKAALKSSIFLFFLEQLCYFNLSPQGDGNRTQMGADEIPRHFNLSPQGDGNTRLAPRTIPRTFQLIPARGRKPHMRLPLCFLGINFNLSPQGDGNSHIAVISALVHGFQLIPARGRKRIVHDWIFRRSRTIPVRGRKPPRHCFIVVLYCTIPARGRKLHGVRDVCGLCSTIPVRGAKTNTSFCFLLK